MEQFEQLLTCAICLDRYRNPKLLPCQHSFCMEPCMDGLVDYVRRQVKCPECRAEHRIPYQGVQAFPTNVTLQRFLELHIEITGELPDPTSGQTMERCGVCSEKSYCSLCVHCEKKCCPECKDAHMDILRREIMRINSQIRRGLHRLQDALALVEKNTLGLQTNCASVAEEVDEIYRRLSKALKDRTEHLRNEVDRYLGTELRGLIQLKENLELEIANIQSNCDLAEAHINENVPWDDSELLDTKELFLRTVEFIRNFDYEAGDYGRRARFVMAHDPNQLVLHMAGYGELNIKPETGTGGLLGSSSSLAPPGGSPGLMRSKSDHRLASQYRQQEEERLARNRYVPEYEYEPEYEAPRNKSRYRSRFMRHRDGDDSDGDSRSTVRFTSTPQDPGLRERVLDTEDAARGPLSGIFRLTDSPRVMRKLQEYERAGRRKKEEPAQPPAQQPQPPKPQIQVRKVPTAMARQASEDDEISKIKKQNKTAAAAPVETVEERQPAPPTPVHPPTREVTAEREPEESARRSVVSRRTSTDTHAPATRSASSDSSTGSESSTGSGIRSTGAPFTAEEMKQKYLSRAPPAGTPASAVSSGPASPTKESTNASPVSRPFQSRFLGSGNRAAPPPPSQPPTPREETPMKKKEEEEEEDEGTSSSSEETESETEEESETDPHPSTATQSSVSSTPLDRQRTESAMARTDIGPLLARSAEARRGSKEDSPSTRYSSPRGSPAQSVTSPTTTTTAATTTATSPGSASTLTSAGGYTSRTFSDRNDEPSTDRIEDRSELAAKNAAYKFDSADALRSQSSNRTHKDGSTDTDETITSSSSSSVNSPENLKGTGNHSRIENRSLTEEDALMGGRSGNGVNSLLSSRTDERTSVTDYLSARDKGLSVPESTEPLGSPLGTPGSHGHRRESVPGLSSLRPAAAVREPSGESSDRSNASSADAPTNSETDESETDSSTESGSGTETDEEEENSRDENSNFKNKKTDRPSNASKQTSPKSTGESTDSNTDDDDHDDDDEEEGTTVLAADSNSHSENSPTRTDRYDNTVKRSGSSITGEKSVEELFDDNGWVITDQDLQSDHHHRPAGALKPTGDRDNSARDRKTDDHQPGDRRKNGMIGANEPGRTASNESGDHTPEKTDTDRTGRGLSVSTSSESLTRSRVYRQGSIGKNGWLVSDESESESDRPISPVDNPRTQDVPPELRKEHRASGNAIGPAGEPINQNSNGNPNNRSQSGLTGDEPMLEKNPKANENAWSIDENGWVVLNKIEEKSVARDVEDRGAEETSTIRSQTTDHVLRTSIENGALVANAARSKEIGGSDEHGDTAGVSISIPMQMVTTVFCVSVLCYSVLINLFL